MPEYVGGDVAPADLWGRAPIRGEACRIVEEVQGEGETPAFKIVDALIAAGLLPKETQ